MARSSYLPLQTGGDSDARPIFTMIVTANNAVLIIISVVILLCSMKEEPTTPIRLWVWGYVVLCLVQVFTSWLELCSDTEIEFISVGMCKCVLGVAALVWYVLGICWVVIGGQPLLNHAPHLYWLSVVLLGMPLILTVIGLFFCCCCVAMVAAAAAS